MLSSYQRENRTGLNKDQEALLREIQGGGCDGGDSWRTDAGGVGRQTRRPPYNDRGRKRRVMEGMARLFDGGKKRLGRMPKWKLEVAR